tara:strand:+ start:112 stop:663 length:552 start_codon:yes stop_codon:yes gene_type:complete
MKYIKLFIILLIFRTFDLTTTYFVGEGDLTIETSPLVRTFGFGWYSIITFNLLLLLVFCFLFYLFNGKNILSKEKEFCLKINKSFKKYLLYVLFNKELTLKQILFTSQVNIKTFFHIIIISSISTIILISLFAGIQNLLVKFYAFILTDSPEGHTFIARVFSLVFFLCSFLSYSFMRFKRLTT